MENTGGFTSEVRLADDLSSIRVFPPDNWWNQSVSGALVDSESDRILEWIGKDVRLHPDFGPPPFGVPYVTVGGDQPLVLLRFVAFGDESDLGAPGRPEGYPIPEEAKTQPNYIEGAFPGGGVSGDRHLLLIDRDRGLLYETFATRYDPSDARWLADSGAVFDLARNDRRPEGWTSADAAGLAILPGLVRYDEASSGEIRHALRFTVRATDGFVWPASHRAGATAGAPPLGLRLRLKPNKDLSVHGPLVQTIFRAMQRYGLILADNGSDLFITGSMDARWNNDVLNPAFRSLRVSDFEVVQRGWR